MDIDNILLIKGVGDRENNQLCVMSLAALIAGEEHTDHPVCACPVLTSVAIRLNDGPWWDSDEQRTAALKPLAQKMIGTRSTTDVERARAHKFIVLAFSTFAPRALEIAADKHPSSEHADKLRSHAAKLREVATKLTTDETSYQGARAAADAAADAADADARYAADAARYAAADAAPSFKAEMRDALLNALIECCDEAHAAEVPA